MFSRYLIIPIIIHYTMIEELNNTFLTTAEIEFPWDILLDVSKYTI